MLAMLLSMSFYENFLSFYNFLFSGWRKYKATVFVNAIEKVASFLVFGRIFLNVKCSFARDENNYPSSDMTDRGKGLSGDQFLHFHQLLIF